MDEIHRYDEFEHVWEANFGKLNTRREQFSYILKDYTLMIYGGFSETIDNKEPSLSLFVEDDFCLWLAPQ